MKDVRGLLKSSGWSVIAAVAAVDEFKKMREAAEQNAKETELISSLNELISEYAKTYRTIPPLELATLLIVCSLMDNKTLESQLNTLRETIAQEAAWESIFGAARKETLH